MKISVEELERISGFWKRSPETQMSQADIYGAMAAFAQVNKNGVLGTGHDGNVRCTPVDYAFHDDAFWIFSEGGQKFTHLYYNSNVSLAIYDASGTFSNLHSLQVMGTAELIDPSSNEYVRALDVRHIPLKGIQQLPYPMYLIKITPTEMILLNSDFKKEGLAVQQVWTKHGGR